MALLGDLQPYFLDFKRLLKSIADTNCRMVGEGAPITNSTSAGTGNIPAGFSSMSIVLLSGSIDVDMSDGSVYPMTTIGESLVQASTTGGSLPAYTITGTGTWKWVGVK